MDAQDEPFDVVIAGGGPVGTGLAIELGQRGVRTCVVERHAAPQHVPKGQNLTQRSMEHFRAWGAEAELRAARTIPPSYGIGGLTAYGTLTGRYHYDWLQRERVRPFYSTDNERLPQYATEKVLRGRAAQVPAVQYRAGWTVEAVEQDGTDALAHVRARDGGAVGTVRGRYVVGCDGARSAVRTAAGISQTLSDHDKVMVLLVFHSRRLGEIVDAFPGKSYYNVLQPALEGYWLFFGRVDLEDNWFFHAPVPRSAKDGGFDFNAYLEQAVGAAIDVDFQHVGFWDLRFAIADHYRSGPMFVAGDAAHSHPPYGGYGINTGLEDARNLGWKLAAVLQGWGGPALLDSYHVERHGVFASTACDFIEKAISTDRDFLRAFDPERDQAAFEREWQARATGAKEEVGAFEPNYEGSPVIPGTWGPGGSAVGQHVMVARAGHHIAPQPLTGGDVTSDRLGPGFTLLALDADPSAVAAFQAGASAHSIPMTVVQDGPGPAREAYGHSLVLVRPDHFVAWAGDGATEAAALTILGQSAGWTD